MLTNKSEFIWKKEEQENNKFYVRLSSFTFPHKYIMKIAILSRYSKALKIFSFLRIRKY